MTGKPSTDGSWLNRRQMLRAAGLAGSSALIGASTPAAADGVGWSGQPAITQSTTGSLSMGRLGYATAEATPSLGISDTSVTVECWLNHDGTSDENAGIVFKGNDEGIMLRFVGSGQEPQLMFGVEDWSYSTLTSDGGIPANQWTHVACVYDGAELAIYIDGELDASTDEDDTVDADHDHPLRIGTNNSANGQFYSGQIDELRIWGTARTVNEVTSSYERRMYGNEEELLAYYRTCGVTDRDGNPILRNSARRPLTGALEGTACSQSGASVTDDRVTATPTNSGSGGSGGESDGGDAGTGSDDEDGGGTLGGSSDSNESSRGFFTNGENTLASSITRTQLTLVGIVLSIAGIVIELLGVRN